MDQDKALINLGLRIKQLRKEKGMTQMDLAAKMGKDDRAIGRLENGRTNPTFKTLLEVATGLEMSVEELMKGF